jgi:hypothetical protein
MLCITFVITRVSESMVRFRDKSKSTIMKKVIYSTLFAIGVLAFVTACNKNEDEPTNTDQQASAKAYSFGESSANDADAMAVEAQKTGSVVQRLASTGCVTVTNDSVNNVIYIDFGTGCIGNDSIERKGIIKTTYTGDYFAQGSVITVTFIDYYVNGRKLQGTRTITNTGLNPDGNMTWEVQATDMKLTNAEGKWRYWNSTRTREMLLGLGTPDDVSDDKYRINGVADGGFSDGSTFVAQIKDLIRESACPWINQGTMDITVNGKDDYVADFGNGDCDNIVVVTLPNGSRENLLLK